MIRMLFRSGMLTGVGLTLAVGPLAGQPESETSLRTGRHDFAGSRARWRFSWENDDVAIAGLYRSADQRYTNGLHLAVTRDAGSVAMKIADVGVLKPFFLFHGSGAELESTLLVGQTMHTPTTIETFFVEPRDRPFASHLFVGGSINRSSSIAELGIPLLPTLRVTKSDELGLRVGVMGGPAWAESAQAGFHALKLSRDPKGWEQQAQPRPAVSVLYASRLTIGNDYLAVTPEASGLLGEPQTFLEIGVTGRVGIGLERFAPRPLIPTIVGEEGAEPVPAFRWEFFHSLRRRRVFRNGFLDHDLVGGGPAVGRQRYVSDRVWGLTVGSSPWAFTYQWVHRSAELDASSPFSRSHDFAVLSLSREAGGPVAIGRAITFLFDRLVIAGSVGSGAVRIDLGTPVMEARDDAHAMRIAFDLRGPWGFRLGVDGVATGILAQEPGPTGGHTDRFVRSIGPSIRWSPSHAVGIGIPEFSVGWGRGTTLLQRCGADWPDRPLGEGDQCEPSDEAPSESGNGVNFGFFYGVPVSDEVRLGLDATWSEFKAARERIRFSTVLLGLRWFPS